MKILNAQQTKEADQYTIDHEPISSINLMERASNAFAQVFHDQIKCTGKVHIFCGTGNNGGDGFAVGRILHHFGYKVQCYLVNFSSSLSEDCIENKTKMDQIQEVDILEGIGTIDIKAKDVIIDAIFGSGLDRAISGIHKTVIEYLNQLNNTKVALDTPSGLAIDKPLDSIIFKADYTISFQLPKLAQLLPQHEKFVGKLILADIGLHPSYLKEVKTNYHYLDDYFIKKAIYKRKPLFSHKGTNGHGLIIAGSQGKIGAAQLAIKACIKSGSGLVSGFIPKFGHDIIQSQSPETMLHLDAKDYISNIYLDLSHYQGVGVGPGIDQRPETIKAFINLLRNAKQPIVIDADGINIIANDAVMHRFIPKNSILSPHPGEFKRLVKGWKDEYERLEKQKDYAFKYQCYIILKGRNTSISTPEGHVYFNSTGNPGMASAGSGDVLTGILTGLLAQGYNPLESSLLGTFIHGRAGDLALAKESYESLIASDIINHLGQAFKSIQDE